MPRLIISLDFELFWGVALSRTLPNYRTNVQGEWTAIPRILGLFKLYGIHATWATVGMVMCRNYEQWRDLRPSILPGYVRSRASTYGQAAEARDNPNLFFARPLVQRILETPGQEVASHSYSHFYCAEPGATPEQFAADLDCAKDIAGELNIRFRSFVFPRNQIRRTFLPELPKAGIHAYRGTPSHWVYRDGDSVPGGFAGRAVRFADTWLPLTGIRISRVRHHDELTDVPADLFLRPWSPRTALFEPLRRARIKRCMTLAAETGGSFHLWWHPHNFGLNVERNIEVLESILKHYLRLRDEYGMQSTTMFDATQAGNHSVPRGNRPYTTQR
jgi:peptidoglycan/xylan/chitin deacetylase (PgdA/CDA1 family)